MRPSVSRRTASTHGAGGRTSGTVGMPGPCTSGPLPAKGDHSQNWRATDPSTSGHQPHNWSSRRYYFLKPRVRRSRSRGQFDKSHCGQSEISSTSCPSACWRLWYRRCYHSTVSLCLLSAVRFPLVFYFPCVLVVYFHVSSSSSCGSRLEGWKRSSVLVVVESQDLSELGLCVVHGAASPDPEDGLRYDATPYNSKEESSKGLFQGDTASTDWPFGCT